MTKFFMFGYFIAIMVGISAIQYYNTKPYISGINSNNQSRAVLLSPLKSDTVSFSSKSFGITEYNKLLKDIMKTGDKDIMNLEEAVAELASLDIPAGVKADYILACTYKGTKKIIEINKKALLMLKKQLLDIQNMPDLAMSIQKCLDSKHKIFDSKKFKDLFDIRKRARIQDVSAVYESGNFRYVELDRRKRILAAVKNGAPFTNFETSCLFEPLSQIRTDILLGLRNDRFSGSNLPGNLYNQLIEAVSKNNFDLKDVYRKYYSKLADCKTLDEVRRFYPELKFIKTKPTYDKNRDGNSINNILSHSTKLYENMMLNALRQAHLELTPKNSINVVMPNGQTKSLLALKIAGYDISTPSDSLLEIFKQCDDIIDKYASIPEFDSQTLRKIAEEHAIRTSKYWADYKEMTNNDIWMPIRFIRDKYSRPQKSAYATDNLIDECIASIYLSGHGIYSSNPLSIFDGCRNLTTDIINAIDKMYMPIFRHTESKTKIDKKAFKDFSSRFDRVGMKKSIQHMEHLFRQNFMNAYYSGARKERYDSHFASARALINEKLELQKQIKSSFEDIEPKKKSEWVQGELFE